MSRKVAENSQVSRKLRIIGLINHPVHQIKKRKIQKKILKLY